VTEEKGMKTLSKMLNSIHRYRHYCLLSVLLLCAFFNTGCSPSLELESQWCDREIIIDGKSKDWLGALYYFEDENVSAGFLNDEDRLYLCMIAESQILRAQVMMQGLTVWFDPEGGRNKAFGIRFPIITGEMRDRITGMRLREEGQDREFTQEHLKESLTDIEILGPGKDSQSRMKIKDAGGIEVQLEASSGMMVYELKVPLHRDELRPYALSAMPGDNVGIGLEIPKPDRSAMQKGMGSRSPGGTGIPGGGRCGFGGRPGGGRGMPQMLRGLNVWITLQLSPAANR
jgi:hypothetical protein